MIQLPKNKVPRYELKYLITAMQAEQLRLCLDTLCFRDENTNSQGQYNIRSLYFDDYQSSAFRDNEMGIAPRRKFRFRIYNCDESVIRLEQKVKIGGKILKDRAVITRDFYEAVLGDADERIEYPGKSALINQFMTARQLELLGPSVIVDYDREPYVYPDGDVRITFDRNIAFSDAFESFFEKDIFLQPVLPAGMQLLEVKYTEFLPEFIHQQLNQFHLQQCAFSKFYLSEKYKRMGE